MNRTWLTILNEIINSETNKLSVKIKYYNKSIKLRVDKYHHYLRNHSKLDSIISIIINLENILGYSVTEIQKDDSTTYIIKKDGIKNIKCNSRFLYDNDSIIPDRIDDEYTGYVELKKTSAILQNITFKIAGNIENINDPKKWITSENYVEDMLPQFAIPYLITLFHAKLLSQDFYYNFYHRSID